MKMEHIGLAEIRGPLVTLQGVSGIGLEEMAEIRLGDGSTRTGRVIAIEGERAVLQIFEGTQDMSLSKSFTRFNGRPMELPLSGEMMGRVFDGAGREKDGLGPIYPEFWRDINGSAINPVSRQYPRNCIFTGISAIDGMATLVRGQKLPIFTGAGMSHNELAAQIARQAKISGEDEEFAVVFAAMGVKNDVAAYFKRSFERSGALRRVVMFLNLASDPIIERILTPRCALTAAEYLAFDRGMHVLVIMTDMTSYCEALREFSSSKGEIPSRKGYPSYLYSDLASLYERAGMIRGKKGSVTQVPILTMPGDDITHPIPDLTGFITEGQIVLSRDLEARGIYPPVDVLPSLSRLMKDGIGKGSTREDHANLAGQLFASYSRVQEVRALAGVVGTDELSRADKASLAFGDSFERLFVNQGMEENREIGHSLDLGWKLLSMLPVQELSRLSMEEIEKYIKKRA